MDRKIVDKAEDGLHVDPRGDEELFAQRAA